jgi:adenine phosphoribosyltransferase
VSHSDYLKKFIRDVPDFPHPGILFRDITPLLRDASARRKVVAALATLAPAHLDAVVAVEARGFLFGAPLADMLNVPLVLIRKPGKLPGETRAVNYALEYGNGTLQMQKDDLPTGAQIFLVDDLLATGGTLAAACELLEEANAEIVQIACLIELSELEGRAKLKERTFDALLSY